MLLGTNMFTVLHLLVNRKFSTSIIFHLFCLMIITLNFTLDDIDKALPLSIFFFSRGERPLIELYLEPGVFSERCTDKLPLRVDFIHMVEFGEVSGHRVLIKRGPGNRGTSQRGSTHEATSGMSSRPLLSPSPWGWPVSLKLQGEDRLKGPRLDLRPSRLGGFNSNRPGAHVCWCGVCGSACAPVCAPVSRAARLACPALASRVCVCWCGVWCWLWRGERESLLHSAAICAPLCIPQWGPRPWTPIFLHQPPCLWLSRFLL